MSPPQLGLFPIVTLLFVSCFNCHPPLAWSSAECHPGSAVCLLRHPDLPSFYDKYLLIIFECLNCYLHRSMAAHISANEQRVLDEIERIEAAARHEAPVLDILNPGSTATTFSDVHEAYKKLTFRIHPNRGGNFTPPSRKAREHVSRRIQPSRSHALSSTAQARTLISHWPRSDLYARGFIVACQACASLGV